MNQSPYTILPLRFRRINGMVLITGEAGDFHFLWPNDFYDFIEENLDSNHPDYHDLKSKDFLAEGQEDLVRAIDMTATRYRSRKHFLNFFYIATHDGHNPSLQSTVRILSSFLRRRRSTQDGHVARHGEKNC